MATIKMFIAMFPEQSSLTSVRLYCEEAQQLENDELRDTIQRILNEQTGETRDFGIDRL